MRDPHEDDLSTWKGFRLRLPLAWAPMGVVMKHAPLGVLKRDASRRGAKVQGRA